MKRIPLFVLFTCIFAIGFSQETVKNKNSIHINLLGTSGLYSINAERLLMNHGIINYAISVGVGFIPRTGNDYLSVPVSVLAIYASGKHHIDAGLGLAYQQGVLPNHIENGIQERFYVAEQNIYFTPTIGYRFDKLSKGLVVKVYYSPLILLHSYLNSTKTSQQLADYFENEDGLNDSQEQQMYQFMLEYDNFFGPSTSEFNFFGASVGFRF